MTSHDQNAADRPDAGADDRTADARSTSGWPTAGSAGDWSGGGVAGRVRPPRRPAPSRRLSQVRSIPLVPAQRVEPVEEQRPDDDVAETAGDSGTPLGVLIGGSPGLVESSGSGVRASARRVAAELLRFSAGTCQVVLPEWRPAIAVSVPTEQLQQSTGLGPDELRAARLSVLINPEAVHDRELGLRDWQAELPSVRGRRRGWRQVR
ncbi:hypothetical protein AB0K51_29450 [Kitasatospora sp. NPDC049285]|uniref:hypothetical protein n=1 Tax=Kitasatospora sp. NPDC049285 TaxID=3157096 RepID=UPI003425BCB8